MNREKVILAFQHYSELNRRAHSRALFESNLAEKLESNVFTQDISPLLAPDVKWNIFEAAEIIQKELVSLLPGEPWKGEI